MHETVKCVTVGEVRERQLVSALERLSFSPLCFKSSPLPHKPPATFFDRETEGVGHTRGECFNFIWQNKYLSFHV